jgi:hypothetical protein
MKILPWNLGHIHIISYRLEVTCVQQNVVQVVGLPGLHNNSDADMNYGQIGLQQRGTI